MQIEGWFVLLKIAEKSLSVSFEKKGCQELCQECQHSLGRTSELSVITGASNDSKAQKPSFTLQGCVNSCHKSQVFYELFLATDLIWRNSIFGIKESKGRPVDHHFNLTLTFSSKNPKPITMRITLTSFAVFGVVFVCKSLFLHFKNKWLIVSLLAAFALGNCQGQNWDDGSNTPMRSAEDKGLLDSILGKQLPIANLLGAATNPLASLPGGAIATSAIQSMTGALNGMIGNRDFEISSCPEGKIRSCNQFGRQCVCRNPGDVAEEMRAFNPFAFANQALGNNNPLAPLPGGEMATAAVQSMTGALNGLIGGNNRGLLDSLLG